MGAVERAVVQVHQRVAEAFHPLEGFEVFRDVVQSLRLEAPIGDTLLLLRFLRRPTQLDRLASTRRRAFGRDPELTTVAAERRDALHRCCLIYTSDAADERSSVDLGGR